MRPIISAGLAAAMIAGLGVAACTDEGADETIEQPVQQTEPVTPVEPTAPAATEPPATEEPAPQ